jgi:bacteriocin biosynthesis cyclodehydratase domain-containing protein
VDNGGGSVALRRIITVMDSDLPPTVRLARHRSVLDVGVDARVIGLDPDTALVIDGLPPPLSGLLDRLGARMVTADLVAQASAQGVAPDTTSALLRRLLDAGALVDAGTAERAARARTDAVVVVSGRGPLAVGIVTGLLHSGIGTVYTDTGGTVHSSDVGTGYTDAERGTPRAGATKAAVLRLTPSADTRSPPTRTVADLVVLADETPDPLVVATLRADGVPHLAVRLRDGTGVVGPLVLPGRTACLGCLELTRSALDPRWPVVAARLIGRAGTADPACASATVGLAVAQAVAAMEGGRPPTLDATLELDVGAGTLVRRHWAAHPECPCGAAGPPGEAAHDAAARASTPEGDTIMR